MFGRCVSIYVYIYKHISKLGETAVTFHNDLPVWSAEVGNSGSDADGKLGDVQQGLVSVKKPEDPGYLLLLAAPWTKRGLSTFFFPSLFDCKQ